MELRSPGWSFRILLRALPIWEIKIATDSSLGGDVWIPYGLSLFIVSLALVAAATKTLGENHAHPQKTTDFVHISVFLRHQFLFICINVVR